MLFLLSAFFFQFLFSSILWNSFGSFCTFKRKKDGSLDFRPRYDIYVADDLAGDSVDVTSQDATLAQSAWRCHRLRRWQAWRRQPWTLWSPIPLSFCAAPPCLPNGGMCSIHSPGFTCRGSLHHPSALTHVCLSVCLSVCWGVFLMFFVFFTVLL